MSAGMTVEAATTLAQRWAAEGVPAGPVGLIWDPAKGKINKRPIARRGLRDYTTDPDAIRRLFAGATLRGGEEWGVGLRWGDADRFVIDLDIGEDCDGRDTLTDLETAHGELPPHPIIRTASGGEHRVLPKRPDQHIGNRHSLGPGIDVRADDGYVVAPGVHCTWGEWKVVDGSPTPDHTDVPGWLYDRLTDKSAGNGQSGQGAQVTHWRQLDRASLDHRDLAALEALEALGGHSPYIGSDGVVCVTRPGKTAGTSATVGYLGPGVVKVFSSNWPPLRAEARYDADQLATIGTRSAAGTRTVANRPDEPGSAPPHADQQHHVTLTPASSVKMDRPRWVWDRRVPVGGTTLMPGREGLGKTMLALHLAARLSRGDLAGQWHGSPADVVYVGLEDDRSTVTVPRLVAAGADLDRFLFADIPSGGTFSVGVDLDALLTAAKGHNVALVILDPLDSHLGAVDTHRKAEVQAAVAKLAVLAQELRCGALGLGHLNKGDARDLLPRVVGSVGFTTSVRSVLGIGPHPERADERVCVLGKANMTGDKDVPAIRFVVEGATVDHPDDPLGIDTGRAVILGEETGIDPNSIIAGSAEERSARDEAAEWLDDVLSVGPMPRAEIVKLARAEGITEMTLKRASWKVGVDVTRNESERGRPSVWALKGFGSPPPEPKPPEPKSALPLTSTNGSEKEVSVHTPGVEPKPPKPPNPGILGPIEDAF